MTHCHDVIVVGSGACGSLAARSLTRGGLDVLLVEAGPDRPELEPERASQPHQAKCLGFNPDAKHLYVDDALHPYTQSSGRPFIWIRGRQLGGRTHQWSLGAPRWSRAEFEAVWPFSYDELTPHYEAVESILRVCGGAEAVGETSSVDVTRAREMDPIELAFSRAIHHRWPARSVVIFPHAAPVGDHARHLLFGAGEPAAVASEAPARTSRALARGRLTILTDTIVRAIATTERGLAAGVRAVDRVTQRERELCARYVVLCASTLESTRILLNSGTAGRGLANSSGALGRYLSDHLWGVGVSAVAADPALRLDAQRHPPLLIPPSTGDSNPNLAKFQLVCSFQRGDDGRAYLRIDAHGQAESHAENRVFIDPEVRDAWGIPALRIEYERTAGDRELAAAMLQGAGEVAEAAGYRILSRDEVPMAPGRSVHELGTARMGRDRATSVVDPYCRCWDVPNLFLCDGSVFPSAGVKNPTITMMAITSRACSHLLRTVRAELGPTQY